MSAEGPPRGATAPPSLGAANAVSVGVPSSQRPHGHGSAGGDTRDSDFHVACGYGACRSGPGARPGDGAFHRNGSAYSLDWSTWGRCSEAWVRTGFIHRYGAIRVSQVCVLLCAAGIILFGLLPASLAGLLVAVAILIGLGYGPITPASSEVLARTTPASQMALMFSIKQTGVPAGAALAGAVLPVASLLMGWRAAMIAVGFAGLGVIVAAQSTRRLLDTATDSGQGVFLSRPGRSIETCRPFASAG